MKLQSFTLQSKCNSEPKPSKIFTDSSSPLPSFALRSKSNSEPKPSKPEFISEFNSLIKRFFRPKKAIIPPRENKWPHKKIKNVELPPFDSGDKILDFEVAANDSGESMSCGSSMESIMTQKFKIKLESLPEAQGWEDYCDMPVDGFGAAYLAGYGWREGRGIGKNARDDVKPVMYKGRTGGEGLGFMADHPPPPVATNAAAGGDKGKESAGRSNVFGFGKEVRVVSGDMIGLKGRVVEVLGGGLVVLDGEVLGRETVRVDEIAGLGSVEEKCSKKLKELKIHESTDDRRNERSDGKNGRDDKYEKRDGKRSRDDVADEEKCFKKLRVMWLQTNIRVRVISKAIKGGKFYLKKGVVVDVIAPGVCDVAMDDGKEVIQGVDQDVLETALPEQGGPVLVLCGKLKGIYGKLVEKDYEKETGVIQDGDTLEMFNVKLAEIAEYLGDRSLLGS